MISQNARSGYIMVLSLIIVSAITALVNQMFQQGQAHNAFVHTMIDREKAQMLALSGVDIARSQLELPKPKKDEKVQAGIDKKKQKSPQLQFLQRVLPVINRTQTFNFTKKRDGMDGKIEIVLSCEDGKLNVNRLFDFEKKKFKGEGKVQGNVNEIMKRLMANAKSYLDKDLFIPLLDFLAKRGYQLNEVTELLNAQGFGVFQNKIFYNPPVSSNEKRSIFLTDIFTVWSDSMKIEPWLLSDSVCGILGLKRAGVDEIIKRKQQVEKLTSQFKGKASWANDWNITFKELYGKTINMLPPGVDFLLKNKFDPTTFSVVCYGTSGKITQKLFAILKKENGDESENGSFGGFEIKKLYWI